MKTYLGEKTEQELFGHEIKAATLEELLVKSTEEKVDNDSVCEEE